MEDIIQLLPDIIASQIAAGEVIQHPTSVIKELVENTIDADAREINILVRGAGRTSIRVIDDGKGMPSTDVRLSFRRHATPRVRKADDLFVLQTMGFRGEALASIAAVAQTELKIRREEDELGARLSIVDSKFTGQEPCSCPVGSNFVVASLFYDVLVRRRFLKSNTTELNHIISAFKRIALVNPQLAFILYSNGSGLFNLRSGGLKQKIVDIFDKCINQDLLPLDVETSMYKLSGFVGKPESPKKKGTHQYFLVNNRYMRHSYSHKAVMNTFKRLAPQGEQVPYFIYFEVKAQDIDISIHPTKTEIKFENEQAILRILFAVMGEVAGLFSDVLSIEFDVQGQPDVPVYTPGNDGAVVPKVNYDPQCNPFKGGESASKPSVDRWEQLYDNISQPPTMPNVFNQNANNGEDNDDELVEDKSPIHYQYKGQYIVAAVKSGLMMIDQYHAHVRVLHERYLQQIKNQKAYPQKVLFPELIEFSPSEAMNFVKLKLELITMGFELTDMGNHDYAIRAVPSGIEGLGAVQLIHNMLVSAKGRDPGAIEEIHRALALSLARSAALPTGQVLNNDKVGNLVNSLFRRQDVNYTPGGKSILHILQQSEMGHSFDS